MLVFGHAGLTLGAGLIAKKSLGRRGNLKDFLESIDIRMLLAGSLLPDIIDKPVGLILFAQSIGYGRIYCHTIIFLALILEFYSAQSWAEARQNDVSLH